MSLGRNLLKLDKVVMKGSLRWKIYEDLGWNDLIRWGEDLDFMRMNFGEFNGRNNFEILFRILGFFN